MGRLAWACAAATAAIAALCAAVPPAVAAGDDSIPVPPGAADELRRTAVVRAVEAVSPAVVNIATDRLVDVRPNGFSLFRDWVEMNPGRWKRRVQGLGTGVVIDPAGYVLTNSHVVSQGDAIHVTLDVARGLEHAHSRNVVHRDIKPDNILLTTSGVAKLADLGLSKRTDEATHLTGASQGFGTPYYMPYEQAMRARYADGRCDIFALGATLYQMATGQPISTKNRQPSDSAGLICFSVITLMS